MRRSIRLATAVIGAAFAALAAMAPSPALATPVTVAMQVGDEGEAPEIGPHEVAIPFAGEATVEPPAPWRIADCGAVQAASELVSTCDAHGFTLVAPAFDADFGTLVLPVELVGGSRAMTVGYRITLEVPDAPTVAPLSGVRPVAAGTVALTPLSAFGLICMLCTEGGAVVPYGVEPVEAGEVWATPTHVVFRASSGYRGPAEVQFLFRDDAGTDVPGIVPVVVYPAGHAVVALDVEVPLAADGTAEIDLRTLYAAAGDEDAVLLSCGPSLHGRAVCDGDGTAIYRGNGATDQFGFHVASGGEQAYGSVTLVPQTEDEDAREADGEPENDATPVVRLVPVAPPTGEVAGDARTPVPTMFQPPTPTEAAAAAAGMFLPFIDLLGRVAP